MKTTTLNGLQLKALLLDTCVHLVTGQHLHRNYKSAKAAYCEAKGIPGNTSSIKLLGHLGATYKDNNLLVDFRTTIAKYGFEAN